MAEKLPTLWSLSILYGNYWFAHPCSPGPQTFAVMFRCHSHEAATRKVKHDIFLQFKGSYRVLPHSMFVMR